MVVVTHAMSTNDLPFTVNSSSMGDVVDYIATGINTNISQGQNLRNFTLSGYPAASGVFTMTNDADGQSVNYIVVVLRNDEILVFLGLCPQTEWSQHQPTFDSILNSTILLTP